MKIGIIVDNIFDGLIACKTRIKLLARFFFNPKTYSYLRELAKEFNVSTNSVREELNQLTKTRLLKCEENGRQVLYTANQGHPPGLYGLFSHMIEGSELCEETWKKGVF